MRPHYIKDNKSLRIPQNIIFYDTETYEKKIFNRHFHFLRLGVLRYVRLSGTKIVSDRYYVFRTSDEFWNIVERYARKKTRLWVISHNQHFDFNVVDGFRQLISRGWTLKRLVIESDIFAVKFTKDERTILVVDSTNYFKSSLKDLGEQIGLPKLSVDFEKATDEELITYCKRDVEILSEYFLRFLRYWIENNLGTFGVSIASLAFNAFRHRFLKHKILVHDNREAIELELDSYRGGRNECFRIGEIREKVYKLDVNSMYPFVMRFNPYPVKFKKILKDVKVDDLKALLRRYGAIADVHIKTNENVFGVRKHKLIFPVGSFRVVLTTPELSYALENNYVLKVYKCALYDMAYIFKDYVDFFYSLKKKAEENKDKVTRNFAKLMLNSLYGKFAQRVRELVKISYPKVMDYGAMRVKDLTTNESYKLYFIGGEAYKLCRERKLFYDANVAIASHVTAYSRMYLWYLMKKAGLENIYYVDTDSLFVNERGYENLKDFMGNELGQLKLEGVSDYAVFFAPKDYIFGDEIKLKGVSPDSIKIGDSKYLVPTWFRTKTLLSKSFLGQVVIENRIKELQRVYDKGIVMPDGKVMPLKLEEPVV